MDINGVKVKDHRFEAEQSIAGLNLHPRNPNIGDEMCILESIEVNGFYGAVIVQESTNCILVGNHRYKTMRDAGADTIPALFIDVDDVEATRIMLVDNKTAESATFNDEILMAGLNNLAGSDQGFLGTGFNDADFSSLAGTLTTPDGVNEIERGQRYFVTIGGVLSKRIDQERFNEWLEAVQTEIGSSDEEEVILEIKRRMQLV